ncbi:hypothetical protein G6F24_014008 [Rhizopus arrhizus]|nr:hypothetical protein G6F24_014008 [Rhizopus arrhizus]
MHRGRRYADHAQAVGHHGGNEGGGVLRGCGDQVVGGAVHAGIDQRGGDLRRRQLPQAGGHSRFKNRQQLLLDRVALGIAALVMMVMGEDHIVHGVRAHVDFDVGADPRAQACHAIRGRVLLHGLVDVLDEAPGIALRQCLQDLAARGEIGIEGALGHVGCGHDVTDGGGLHAQRQAQRLRGVPQFFPPG